MIRSPVVGRWSPCLVHLLLAWGLISGCATTGAEDAPRGEPSSEAAFDPDGEALLLLMADQRLFEPFAVSTIFRNFPGLHQQLAVTLGRIGDARGLPYLESLLEDPAVEVRRAAAFGLGQLGDRNAFPHLLGALGDRDREVGRLAVEALVRVGIPLETIEPAMGVLSEAEVRHRLLPVLFRFTADEIHRVQVDLASQASLQADPEVDSGVGLDPELERWLLYALARSGDIRGLPRLRRGLDSQEPWVRGWAARALGRLGERSDLDRLHPLLQDARPGVVVQALRAARSLIDAGKVAAPDLWLSDLERLSEDQRSWVRLTALEVAGSWTPSPSFAVRLRALASGDRGRPAELALMSLARTRDIEAEQLILRAGASGRPSMRRAAATAAAIAGLEAVVERLRADVEPAVRMAALTAVLERTPEAPGTLSGAPAGATSNAEIAAREALLDSDPGIRTVALDWLAANPVAPLDELMLALAAAAEHRMPDLRVSGSAALAARALEQPLERGAIVAALERLAESSVYIERRAAGEALVALGRERPPLGTIASTRVLRDYRDMASAIKSSRLIELVTERGALIIKLDTRRAPLTCISFIQLAEAGFFDGLEFHRVIADFVAQGGDPRGDGWGGPGYSIRDENNRVPFERGVVGMARSGTHTAGSQFFLTLSEQPHLNGSYTAFGRVVAGEEWLDAIEQGDTISSIREVTSGR